ncbi:MAG TPA: zf-HC2 domain-containing protein [Acidobacteriota bacterium]|nr:zf-HC2 domain-containing protein [Acidobacteriota bacterium]HNB71924.1 zf-HC2 domain-containing protein [Acidobacteriota bacterium]HNG95409.1 zf-HC2 domain-containing protein [Acidobacteriota bacterium]HNJ44166.1 zf-HC2 domain-containing protein [Acidobacteriota bacterium]
MNCDDYVLLLEEFVDGELGESDTKKVEVHLAACPACQKVLAELKEEQAIFARYDTGLELTPNLWQGIEDRLKAEGSFGTSKPVEPQGWGPKIKDWFTRHFHTPQLSPAFTMVVVVAAVGLTVLVMRPKPAEGPFSSVNPGINIGPGSSTHDEVVIASTPKPEATAAVIQPAPPRPVKPAPPPPAAPAKREPSVQELIRDAESKYRAAITVLTRDVKKRRTTMDPLLVARLDSTLEAIDHTIADTKLAVKMNPNDPVAAQYLLTAYAKKVEVLQEMASVASPATPTKKPVELRP